MKATVTGLAPFLLVLSAILATSASLEGDNVATELTVRLDDVEWSTEIASAPVLPGDVLRVELRDPDARRWSFSAPAGTSIRNGPDRWTWRAPAEPGIVTAHLSAAGETSSAVELKLLVQVPASKLTRTGLLNGYRIGSYPSRPLNGNPLYLPPRGFVEVTDQNEDERLSPSFRLGQFTSKQSKDFPKYIVIEPALIARLERLSARLDELDLPSKLHVMSGYRTPFYNRAIGNVRYSLHQWGVAADVFVDENDDGTMDDLNRDGRIDRDDAVVLSKIVDALDRRGGGPPTFAGGLGIYAPNRVHGPFVHVDVRGRPARW
jgi:hypothetical protein